MQFLGLNDKQWIWLATAIFAAISAFGTYSALKLKRRTGHSYVIGLVILGWILQTTGLYVRGQEYGGCPLANQFELVQFVVWSAIALYIFVGSAFRVSLLGVFISGFATIFSILSLSISSWDNLDRTPIFGDNPWIEIHAALALFSYGVFGILALTSAMYLLQSRSLKKKKMGGLFPFLPSIVELATINMRLAWIGFCIFSSSLCIGSIHWFSDLDSVNFQKIGTSILVWFSYGLLIIVRARQNIGIKKYSWTAIYLFIAAILSLNAVGSKPVDIEPTAPSTSEP